MIANITIIVSILGLCFTTYFNIRGNRRSDHKDIEERVKQDTRVDMKLDEIFRVSNETRNSLETLRGDIQSHSLKLTEIEASVKSAHKRIDVISKKVDENENE